MIEFTSYSPRGARGLSQMMVEALWGAEFFVMACRAAPQVAFENRALLQAIPVKGDLFVLVRQPKKKGRAEKGVAKATSQALISGMCVSNNVYNIIQRMDVVNWLHGIHLRAFWWLGIQRVWACAGIVLDTEIQDKVPELVEACWRETWKKKTDLGLQIMVPCNFSNKSIVFQCFPQVRPQKIHLRIAYELETIATEVGSAFDDKWPQASDQIRRTLSFSDQPGSGFRKPGFCHIQMVWDRL